MEKKDVIFLSFYHRNYSRSAVLLNAKDSEYDRYFYQINTEILSLFFDFLKIKRIHHRRIRCVVVMSPCHKIVPIVRLICRRPIILDAGWPLADGLKSRRKSVSRRRWPILMETLRIAIIDYLAFHFSNMVLLETKSQLHRVKQNYKVRESKLRVSLTGFNESTMGNLEVKKSDVESRNYDKKDAVTKVLFRGKITNESGFQNIIEATKLLDDSFELVYVVDRMPSPYNPSPREKFIIGFSESELPLIYNEIDICLGQISSHPRLQITIPHKAFEAAYFGKAYISPRCDGIRELADESDVYYLNDITPLALSNAIFELARDKSRLDGYGRSFQQRYLNLASQQFLGNQLDKWILELTEKPVKNSDSHKLDQ